MESIGRTLTVIRPGALGDTIVAIPALSGALRQAAFRKIVFVGTFPHVNVLRLITLDPVDFARGGWHSILPPCTPGPELRPILKSSDAVICFLKDETGEIAAGLKSVAVHADVVVAAPRPPDGYEHHACRYVAEAFCRARVKLEMEKLTTFALEGVRDSSAPEYFAVHPGSGSPGKNYPWRNFSLAIETISARTGLAPLIFLGPAETEKTPEIGAAARQKGWRTIVEPEHGSAAGLLARAALYVGNDSGFSHLAGICGCPTLTLFFAANHSVWHPIGPHVKVVYAPDAKALAPCVVAESAVDFYSRFVTKGAIR